LKQGSSGRVASQPVMSPFIPIKECDQWATIVGCYFSRSSNILARCLLQIAKKKMDGQSSLHRVFEDLPSVESESAWYSI
jgi:hypothetical protein